MTHPSPAPEELHCQLILILLTEEKQNQIILLHRLSHPMGTLHEAKSLTARNPHAVLVAKLW